MKKIFLLVFLTLFLFNIAGYYFLFLILDSVNRNDVQTALSQPLSLHTLRIHKSELKNIVFKEKGKEILYGGENYDVKEKSLDGDYIVFRCIHDEREKELLTDLDNHIKSDTDSAKKKQNNICKNLFKSLIVSQNKITFITSVTFVFPSSTCHFTSYIFSPVSPPPPENQA